MATLYVENIPESLYRALRERARLSHRSIAAEVVSMLEENVPTEDELAARKQLGKKLARLRAASEPEGKFPSAEEMLREDRSR
jgi:plasmid stability protein